MAITNCLTVIKLGGSDVFESSNVYEDIARLVSKGEKVILVAGGSWAIEKTFLNANKEIKQIELMNGDKVRYCGSEDMVLIEKAYRTLVFPEIAKKLSTLNLRFSCLLGADNNLVFGKKYPALKIKVDDKLFLEKNSMVGIVTSIDLTLFKSLISALDVLVISPPIATHDGSLINVDADMLAATVAVHAKADYLHFLTKTNGILKDIARVDSTVNDIYLNDYLNSEIQFGFVKNRMKQKIRAAMHAVNHHSGAIYTSISSSKISAPITKMQHHLTTHCWKIKPLSSTDEFLTKMLQIPSVSRHEHRLAAYICYLLVERGVKTCIDQAGNIVSKIGKGKKRILMLAHIDTVPGNICCTRKDNKIYARGAVDAKATYAAYIESSLAFMDSEDIEILLIGGVEEEISTAKGGEFVRENYQADNVIIGEPSFSTKITLGYRGIYRLEVMTQASASHSASKDYISTSDQVINIYNTLKNKMKNIGVEDISLRDISSWFEDNNEKAKIIINLRFSTSVSVEDIQSIIDELKRQYSNASFITLCDAPAALYPKTSPLAKSFFQAIRLSGKEPIFVSKTGASFMNRLKKSWDCDMIAYGPGDSSLDHTDNEFISLQEFEYSNIILKDALHRWSERYTPVKLNIIQ